VFFKNISSHNLYLIINFAENQFYLNPRISQFGLEKQDTIIQIQNFFVLFSEENNFSMDSTHPKNYYLNIYVYDMDKGTLLTEINPSNIEIFKLIEGDIDKYHEIFTLIFSDSLF
jgi:hypothetical protein